MRFAIIPGAGGSAWEWHLVRAELEARGHTVIAVDLPSEDESAGLAEYTDTVVTAIERESGATADGSDLVVVAHSLGGFVAPLVAARVPVRRLVLTAAMVPLPGETFEDWWRTSGYHEAVRERDEAARQAGPPQDAGPASPEEEAIATFMHDVEPGLAAEALRRSRDQAGRPLAEPWPLPAWPDVPVSFLVFADDRFFPPKFLHDLARERLGVTADEMPGSHAAYLSRPAALADRLEAYAAL
jgi:pimeloyl-ACP methyl ester carboxylesterase